MAEMLAPKSTVHWVGACAYDHALISCTIDVQLLSYQDPWTRDPGGRTGAIKAKKMFSSKYCALNRNSTQSCAQLPNNSSWTFTMEKCIKEMGLQCVVESRVATAGMLMNKNPLGRAAPQKSQEQSEIVKKLATLITA